MVAANNEEDKALWLTDLNTAIMEAKNRQNDSFRYLNLKSMGKD